MDYSVSRILRQKGIDVAVKNQGIKVAKSRLFWYNVLKYVFMKAETFYEDIGDNHGPRRQ